jgi:type III restriction enzyme
MSLHPDLSTSPYEIMEPNLRWFPDKKFILSKQKENLLPPLVVSLRREVKSFRDSNYNEATETSQALLNWWFSKEHFNVNYEGYTNEFRYFYAQREALETIIFLYDVVKSKSKFDLLRFDCSCCLTKDNFYESWLRMVIKMATGTGKTKVMSLAIAWSFFHKIYEPESTLARNFLLIAPNIIVLDRLYKDFEGLRIFSEDPIIPDNGYAGKDWRDVFQQLVIHKQDDVRATQSVGNIFLTNIQRVYSGRELPPSPDDEDTRDFFLGKRPTGATTDSKVDLGIIVREVDELMVINDEAHHIHDSKLAWFQSIQDIHNNMLQKGFALSLQLDLTATPKHSNGSIFVQTVTDYPLVEAIHQNIVKHPVLPDKPSRANLHEEQSLTYVGKYVQFLKLGLIEWRKAYDEHIKVSKKAILFVMTDDTRNCDEVAEYLNKFPDLAGSVLTIHTKNNGDIDEAAYGKKKEELEHLRKLANEIDSFENPYKAIVSVMMLKEGWDVRNVTTIVGLRAYTAKSNILPEQTLGRGLRKMYFDQTKEEVCVIGTGAFMDFIESIQAEGVELETKPMGEKTDPKAPLIIEVDHKNPLKNINELDIELPILTPSVYRDYKSLSNLNITSFQYEKLKIIHFSPDNLKQIIVFRRLATDEISHSTVLDDNGEVDYRSVIAWFTRNIMKQSRLFSEYNLLYHKVETFISEELFSKQVKLDDPNTIRNLSEPLVIQTIFSTFKQAINSLIFKSKDEPIIKKYIKLSQTNPFVINDQKSLIPKKSVFNRTVGDSHYELEFASFLEFSPDVISYAKNYPQIKFSLDYLNSTGDIANYFPDFFVKLDNNIIVIVETKGLEDPNTPLKMERLKIWCQDINQLDSQQQYEYLFVDQETFIKYNNSIHSSLTIFKKLFDVFTKYK